MNNIVRCPEGHFYDESKHSTCPHCANAGAAGKGSRLTAPFTEASVPETVAEGILLEEAIVANNEKNNDSLEAVIRNVKQNNMITSDSSERTIGIYSTGESVEPVVGWLVCVEGPDKGKDYRLTAGRNFIGRSQTMDVVLEKDGAVSAIKHAIIAYDPMENIFIAIPGESHELFYHNNKVVIGPVSLTTNDVIRIGHTTLMFIACCNDQFCWEKTEEE